MNYQDYIKYDPEKKQYTDSYGYVIDNFTSKPLITEQRAQMPIGLNKIQTVDVVGSEVKIITDGPGATGNILMEPKNNGIVKMNKLTLGHLGTSSLGYTTGTSANTFTASGSDNIVDVIINPKGGDGCLKVGANYDTHVAIKGNSSGKITTRYSTTAAPNLTLETKSTGKIVFANHTMAETLDVSQVDGSSTLTASSTDTATYPNADIKFVPRGLGIVKCNSWTYDAISSTGSPQTLTTNASTKVTINALLYNDFPAGFMSNTADTFQNNSGRTITLMVAACIRENPASLVSGRNLGLYITKSNSPTYQYGQALLNNTTDTTNPTGARALNTSAIITLANNESFSVWASTNAAGVVIGGSNTWNLSIITFRLMP